MSNAKGNFLYGTLMPKIYGIGAAVVIVGAWMKILHLPGASLALTIGLLTEAVIFFLSAFEPKHAEPDWTRVYPELAEDYDGPVATKAVSKGDKTTQKLDHMLSSAKIGPDLIDSLGKGLTNMADSAKKMSNLSSAAVATDEYAKNVKQASQSLTNMNKSYASTANSLAGMADAAKDSQEYHKQVKEITNKLGALNSVYEMELKDANNHMKALNKFYSNLTPAMESMAEAAKNTDAFKGELSKLTGNLTSLNSVYGNMLAAMKGGPSK